MDYLEFAQKIKSKYPNYQDMDDKELAQKIVAKHPEYSDVTFDIPIQSQKPENQNSTIGESIFPRTSKAIDNKAGLGSKALSATADVLSLPQRVLSGIATGAGYLQGGGDLKEAAKEAMQDVGKYKSEESGGLGFAQNMAYDPTLFVPGLGLTKLAKPILRGGKPLTKLVESVGIGAGQGALSGALQSANGDKNLDTGAIAGTAALGAALPLAGAGITKALRSNISDALLKNAERNIDVKMRGGQRGANIGYDPENVLKHGLNGSSVREISDNAANKLNELQNKATQLAKDSDAKFSVDDMFNPDKLGITKKEHPEDYEDMVNLLEKKKEQYKQAYGNIVDAPTAMKIRTIIGDKTKFIGKRGGKGFVNDPDADWQEKTYNAIYGNLKDEIHKNVGSELKAINKAQSEIIPIRQTALRRLPIAESNLRFSPMDALLAGTGGGIGALLPSEDNNRARNSALLALTLAGGRRALGSNLSTKAMYNLSKFIKP